LHYKDYGNENEIMCRHLGHVGVKRNAYDALVTIPKGSRPLGRCNCRQ
jgi:hypothetical protein